MEGVRELNSFQDLKEYYLSVDGDKYTTKPLGNAFDELGRCIAGSFRQMNGYNNGITAWNTGFKIKDGVDAALFIERRKNEEGNVTNYFAYVVSLERFSSVNHETGEFHSSVPYNKESNNKGDYTIYQSEGKYVWSKKDSKGHTIYFYDTYSTLGIVNRDRNKREYETDIPMFDADDALYDNLYAYLKYGDVSNAVGGLTRDELKTDWTIYIDGTSHPHVKIVWRNEKIESDEKFINKTNIGMYLSDNRMQKTEVLDAVPFSSKTYSAAFDEMYSKLQPPQSWFEKKKLSIHMAINYEGDWSTWMYVGINMEGKAELDVYNSIVYGYGFDELFILPGGDLSMNYNDGSTMKIIFGSGENDNGYETPDDDVDNEDEIKDLDTLTSLTRIYRVTQSRLEQLGTNLWADTFYDIVKKINSSPLENVLSVRMLPFKEGGEDTEIVLGNYKTGVFGERVRKSNLKRIKVGELTIEPFYNNFIDFPPYSRMYIYVPYAGIKEIDQSFFYNKKLQVYYIADIISGGALIEIYADNIKHYEFNTQIGVDIPLSSSNRAQLEGKFALNTATSLITGDVKGALHDATNGATAQVHFNTTSTPSPSCVGSVNRTCFIEIDYPAYQKIEKFNSTKGRMCLLGLKIGNLTGYTVCDENVNLNGIRCTDVEREEIKSILSTGFYA